MTKERLRWGECVKINSTPKELHQILPRPADDHSPQFFIEHTLSSLGLTDREDGNPAFPRPSILAAGDSPAAGIGIGALLHPLLVRRLE